MNIYDHEDAFRAANLCAGNLTQLANVLKVSTDKDHARLLIEECQKTYENLFQAFIEGVDYGRKNPLQEKT